MKKIKFQGIEYSLRRIKPDPDFYTFVAPTSLFKVLVDEDLEFVSPEAEVIDNTISFYADEEEMKYSDAKLVKLIYT